MRRRHLQRGIALIATMALILMGGSAYLVSRLKASSASYTVVNKTHNARVLRQAKEALIGWVANQAANANETNPGRMICPEGSAYAGTDGVEGYSAPGLQSVGGTTYSAPTCASVGRFPWRSVGMTQLLDASSEPLWYVVGPTWRMSTTTSYTNINSNTKGDITYGASYSATRTIGSTNVTGLTATQTAAISAGMKVGGIGITAGTTVAAVGSTSVTLSTAATASGTSALTFGEDAVALIVAPGAALDAKAATGCTARTQGRSTPSSSINYADYLECYDATTLQFTSNGGSTASNDQVMIITAAELMPAIEAAVSARIESQIVPVLKAVYASATWGLSAANPLFPYAAPFANPGSSSYQGVAGTYQGLLPFTYTAAICGGDARCTSGITALTRNNNSIAPTLTKLSPPAPATVSSSCSYNASLRARCTGNYDNNGSVDAFGNPTPIVVRMTIRVRNAAMAFRAIDTSRITAEWRVPGGIYATVTTTSSAVINADGSATLSAEATLPHTGAASWQYRFTINNLVLGDHPILSSTDGTTGWFVRNEWYRLMYYATAQSMTPVGLPTPACTTGTNCLTLARPVIGATNATPIWVTAKGHGLATGNQVTVSEVEGNTAANGIWTVAVVDADSFFLNGSAGNGNYTTGGMVTISDKRALLVLAGRSLSNAARPNATLADYLEFGNAAATTTFEQRTVTPLPKPLAVDTAVVANEYSVTSAPKANGTPLYMKAANTNTGAAYLYAGGGSPLEIFNLNGTSLAASQIRANAVVQVTYDGSYYFLSKKPFNDRVIVLDSN